MCAAAPGGCVLLCWATDLECGLIRAFVSTLPVFLETKPVLYVGLAPITLCSKSQAIQRFSGMSHTLACCVGTAFCCLFSNLKDLFTSGSPG